MRDRLFRRNILPEAKKPTRRTILKFAAAGAATLALPRGLRAQGPPTLAWSSGPDLPIPLQEIYAAVHNGEIWVAGGLTSSPAGSMAISGRSFILAPDAQAWRDGPRLSEPMHHPQLASLDGGLYLIGGFRTAQDGAWSMRNTVEVLEDGDWRPVASLPIPIAESHLAVIDGNIHLAGGRTPIGASNARWQDHTDTAAHFVFDRSINEWTAGPPLPTPRNSGAAVMVNKRFYAIGGRTVSGGNLKNLDVFDPATGEWQPLAPMPEARGGIAAAELDGIIHVVGGEFFGNEGSGVFRTVLSYDIAADRWTEGEEMPTPRHGLAAARLGGRVFAIGGAAKAGANETSTAVELHSKSTL